MRARKDALFVRSAKLLVCGDSSVGKSSLICSLVSNHFSDGTDLPDVYTDVAIPENSFWANRVQVRDSFVLDFKLEEQRIVFRLLSNSFLV